MTIEQEIIQVLSQLPAAIEKAFMEVWVQRHPGHPNQKTHGNRFGAGQAKESLRRLKDDKGAREQYKARARGRDVKRMDSRQLQEGFNKAKTAGDRASFANEMFGRSGFADKTVAKTRDEIPKIEGVTLTPGAIGSRGKLAVFQEDNGTFGIGPVIQDEAGGYATGTLGKVRRVKPEFSGEGPAKPKSAVEQTLNRTKKERAADIKTLSKMPLSKLRKHQDLVSKQIEMANKQGNTKAVEALQARQDDLMAAVSRYLR
jgi:hypothetical protein